MNARPITQPTSPLRSVTVPNEHGGWGLTAEPAVLGLLIAPSVAGVALGLAAIVAFMARTPLRVILVDHHRDRDLERTHLARRVFLVEMIVIALLGMVALMTTDHPFWWPLVVAAPLIIVELWFDMRSRSRRLIPELAGSVGVSAVAAVVILAGGGTSAVAAGAWCILAARVLSAIPAVRALIARLHGRPTAPNGLLAADLVALGLLAAAVTLDQVFVAGAVAVMAMIGGQRVSARQPVPPPKVIGLRQMAIGLAVVVITALGYHLL